MSQESIDKKGVIKSITIGPQRIGGQPMPPAIPDEYAKYMAGLETAYDKLKAEKHALVEALEFTLKNIKKDLSCRLYGGCSAYIQLKNCRGCKAYNDYMAEIDDVTALLATHSQEEAGRDENAPCVPQTATNTFKALESKQKTWTSLCDDCLRRNDCGMAVNKTATCSRHKPAERYKFKLIKDGKTVGYMQLMPKCCPPSNRLLWRYSENGETGWSGGGRDVIDFDTAEPCETSHSQEEAKLHENGWWKCPRCSESNWCLDKKQKQANCVRCSGEEITLIQSEKEEAKHGN